MLFLVKWVRGLSLIATKIVKFMIFNDSHFFNNMYHWTHFSPVYKLSPDLRWNLWRGNSSILKFRIWFWLHGCGQKLIPFVVWLIVRSYHFSLTRKWPINGSKLEQHPRLGIHETTMKTLFTPDFPFGHRGPLLYPNFPLRSTGALLRNTVIAKEKHESPIKNFLACF